MKEALGLIPQVFYDLIGRVAPGAAILTAALFLFGDIKVASLFLHTGTAAAGILFMMFLLAAYVAGVLLGGIGFLLEDRRKPDRFDSIQWQRPGEPLREDDIYYIYDFILARDPAAGVRLVKLRAEMHLSRVLITGSL